VRGRCPVPPRRLEGAFALLAMVLVALGFPRQHRRGADRRPMAHAVFTGRSTSATWPAIVACANAGGAAASSATPRPTMMWIHGVSPLAVLHASSRPRGRRRSAASRPQAPGRTAIRPILQDDPPGPTSTGGGRGGRGHPRRGDLGQRLRQRPLPRSGRKASRFIGTAVWWRCSPWCRCAAHLDLVPGAVRGSVFLLSLVLAATMMRSRSCPPPPADGARPRLPLLVFDNIPLTALALRQGATTGDARLRVASAAR